MRHLLSLSLLLPLAAGCVPAPPDAVPPAPAGEALVCRFGPDGADPAALGPAADRGIGGTGGPAPRLADRGMGGTGRMADRGLGGTGQVADRGMGGTGRQADRGIGGTGIVGIVTGFASLCVNGLEVGLDTRAPVDVDGINAGTDALRAGQVVAVAAGPNGAATKISIRHEVSGPVEAVLSADPGLFVVSGQRVRASSQTIGSAVVTAGTWVAVSGLRGPDGDVIASRIDARAPGTVIVHGPLIAADGVRSVGGLKLPGASGGETLAGTYVFVTGAYINGGVVPNTIAPDVLLTDPLSYFGSATTHLVIEGHASISGGQVALSGGFRAPLAPGLRPPAGLRGPVVISLDPLPGGGLAVTGISPAPRIAGSGAGGLGGSGGGRTERAPGDQAVKGPGGNPLGSHPVLKPGGGPGLGRPFLQPGVIPGPAGAAAAGRIGVAPVGGLKAVAPKVKLGR